MFPVGGVPESEMPQAAPSLEVLPGRSGRPLTPTLPQLHVTIFPSHGARTDVTQ